MKIKIKIKNKVALKVKSVSAAAKNQIHSIVTEVVIS